MSDFPPVGMLNGEDSKFFTIEHQDNTVSTETEDAYQITRPRSTRVPGRVFTTGFTEIPSSDKALLESFWESVRGRANVFSWTDPTTGQEAMVRFAEPLRFQYEGTGGYHTWSVEVKLKEV